MHRPLLRCSAMDGITIDSLLAEMDGLIRGRHVRQVRLGSSTSLVVEAELCAAAGDVLTRHSRVR